VPAEHLKRVERSGFGPFLFAEWRKDPDFVLNRPEHEGATILLAGANFGSGSSREHAVWALEDSGFRAVIASSFGDIFRNNCSKIGIVAVELPSASVRALTDAVVHDPFLEITVDLEELKVMAPAVREDFEIDPYTRWRLIEGLDDIDLTLRHEEAIARYEEVRPSRLPSIPLG
jgi:3-isopropylmalate/(R)-2-methylmalate dehydratase small subunit